eukprot:m.21509 g.21509  ORF g.21509 m.21509 type:complete len:415 (+) comp3903_c0_seq1:1424-2668(+)
MGKLSIIRIATLKVELGPGVTNLKISCTFEVRYGDEAGQLISDSNICTREVAYPTQSDCKTDNSFIKASQQGVVTAHVDVIDLKLDKKTSLPKHVLCSVLADLDDTLTRNFAELYTSRALLGPGFTHWITSELNMRRGGGGGLPGTIMPEVPTGLLQTMRERVPPVLHKYASDVAAAARKTFVAEIEAAFQDFPRLSRALVDEVGRVCDEQEREVKQHLELLLRWESIVHTSNHYFMDTVKKVRAAIEASRGEQKEGQWSHTITLTDAKRLDAQGRSNEEQKVMDMQIEIYAYWKTMRKRLLDYAQSCARWTLVVNPVEHLLHSRLQLAVENAASDKGLLAVMAPEKDRQMRYEQVCTRKKKLSEAAAAITNARAAWVGRPESPRVQQTVAATPASAAIENKPIQKKEIKTSQL